MTSYRLWMLIVGLVLALAGCSPSTPEGDERADALPANPVKRSKDRSIELARLVLEAERASSYQEKMRILKNVLKADSTHRQALFRLTRFSQEEAIQKLAADRRASIPLFLESARYARKLRAAHEELRPEEAEVVGIVLFNEAWSLALLGKPEEALDALEEAIDAGFRDLTTFRADPDLALLRDHPRFEILAERLEAAEADSRSQILARSIKQARADLKNFQPFPFSFRLPDLDGQVVSSEDFSGPLTVLNFWGTQYPPCLREIPHLVELQAKYKEQGLTVVGLAYEKGTREQVQSTLSNFVENQDIPYPILIGDEQTRNSLPRFTGYPTTLFLDSAGMARFILMGHADKYRLEGVVTVLLDPSAEVDNLTASAIVD